MLIQDFTILSSVRRVLVRSNIDYTRIEVGTIRGVVYFSGAFRMSGVAPDRNKKDEPLTYRHLPLIMKKHYELVARTLYALERRVKSVPGVQGVVFQFSNWKKASGQWMPVKESERKEREA